jgi:hypothetical protein
VISAVLLFDGRLGGAPVRRLRLRLGARLRRRYEVLAVPTSVFRLTARVERLRRSARAEPTHRASARADVRPSRGARRRMTFKSEACETMSITSHLTFFRGEDVTVDFQMAPPADVTGWTITFTLADTLGGTAQFSKTASITDGPRGRFRVTIASADTASLTAGRYVWDARRTDSGSKATLADGWLDLRREVTA